jgi:hypothetical protein
MQSLKITNVFSTTFQRYRKNGKRNAKLMHGLKDGD